MGSEIPVRLTDKGKHVLKYLLSVGKDYVNRIQEKTEMYASRGSLSKFLTRLFYQDLLKREWIRGNRYVRISFADPAVFFFLLDYLRVDVLRRGTVAWLLTKHSKHPQPTLLQGYATRFVELFPTLGLLEALPLLSEFSRLTNATGQLFRETQRTVLRDQFYYAQLFSYAVGMFLHLAYLHEKNTMIDTWRMELENLPAWKAGVKPLFETVTKEEYRSLLRDAKLRRSITELEEEIKLPKLKELSQRVVTILDEQLEKTLHTYCEAIKSSRSFLLTIWNLYQQEKQET